MTQGRRAVATILDGSKDMGEWRNNDTKHMLSFLLETIVIQPS